MATPTVGYLGMGIMGTCMATRLVGAKYKVIVWNRTKERCQPLVEAGAQVADTPQALVEACDIVFACTSDPVSARQVVFGEKGVLAGMKPGKRYVDMSTVDEECVLEICAAVKAKGAEYLEAPVSGSKPQAAAGQLVILAAGDEELKKYAQPMFDVMSKKTFFLGEVGAGSRMKLVINMMMGMNLVALSEGLALGTKAGLKGSDIMAVVEEGGLKSPMYSWKGPKMLAGDYDPNFPLKHQQKDLRLAVDLGQKVGQQLHGAAAANEVFKAALTMGHGDADIGAVFEAVKR